MLSSFLQKTVQSISTVIDGVKYTVETGKNYAIVGVLGQTVCNAIDKSTFSSNAINLKTSVTINSKTYDVLEIAPFAFFQ